MFHLPRNGQGDHENHLSVGIFEICTWLVETDQMTLSAPQFDSVVMGITKPGRCRTGDRWRRGLGHTIASVCLAKSIVLEKRNFTRREFLLCRHRSRGLCVHGGAPLLSWSIDVGGPQAMRTRSANSAAAFVQWGTKDPAFADATDSSRSEKSPHDLQVGERTSDSD